MVTRHVQGSVATLVSYIMQEGVRQLDSTDGIRTTDLHVNSGHATSYYIIPVKLMKSQLAPAVSGATCCKQPCIM